MSPNASGTDVESAVLCRGLVKRYDGLVAVNGLDLQVRRGECFGLLGPNGAGKTTTVEILEGLLVPTSGVVEVLGEPVGRRAGRIRERIGITLQETRFLEKLGVLETLRLFRSFYREGPAPEELLETVGLVEKARAWVRDLSGGQRQRLSVACALVGSPDLLFLDEPTTGLDPQSRRRIWEVIDTFRSRGGTVLLTTHYMEEAERLCNRVAIIDQGRIIAQDTPAALISGLRADHVVEFRTTPSPDLASLAALPAVRDVRQEDGTVRVTVGEVHRAVPALMAELHRQGSDLTELTTHHATLEDVFVALTGRHLRDE
jgi:ABC-2 type transport system ATP-binding protein